MRRAWVETQGGSYRLVSESTLFPGKAQPHLRWFGRAEACVQAAQRGGLQLEGGPIPMPLVTAQDREEFRVKAQRDAENALTRDASVDMQF